MVSRATPNVEFWRDRRVLVTGHTGFKGAWLSHWLVAMGAVVAGFSDRIPTTRSLFVDLGLTERLEDHRGDVRDPAAVDRVIAASQPDIVLHLAAQSLVRASYQAPVDTYATNVMGTVHVLDTVRRQEKPCLVVVVTSDKCYENREQIWAYRETDAMGGYDPYSSSKGCAELVAQAFARSFDHGGPGFTCVSARAGNVIGGGDWSVDRLIPDLVRGLAAGASVPIRNPDAVRPWQHVLEPLCGYLVLAERASLDRSFAGDGWNFGPDRESEQQVRTVADAFCRQWGKADGWHFAGFPGQQHEAQQLRLDSTKARLRLGWAPHWSLAQALAASVEVYQSNARETAALVERQIASYLKDSAS